MDSVRFNTKTAVKYSLPKSIKYFVGVITSVIDNTYNMMFFHRKGRSYFTENSRDTDNIEADQIYGKVKQPFVNKRGHYVFDMSDFPDISVQ